jgi:hypothetical protein
MPQWLISDLAELMYGPDHKKTFPAVIVAAEEELRAELERLARLEPRVAEIALPAADTINLCIGGPLAGFEYSRHRNKESKIPSGEIVAPTPPALPTPGFLCENTHSEILAKYQLPVEEIIDIVIHFFRTGSLPPGVTLVAESPSAL